MIELCVQEIQGSDHVEGWFEVMDGCWPFQRVADQLIVDCLDPSWETRHGAALALREILSCQAASAAVVGPVDDKPSGTPASLLQSVIGMYVQGHVSMGGDLMSVQTPVSEEVL
jgi:hypothetical protein